MKKRNLLLFILLCCLGAVKSQNTYTWAVDTGNFLTPNSWLPSRNNPAENDILVFDGNIKSNTVVNNIRTQTIGRLIIKNNANVNFNTSILDTGIGNIQKLGGNLIRGNKLNKFMPYDLLTDAVFSNDFLFKTGSEIKNLVNDSTFYFYNIPNSNSFNIPFYRIPKLVISYKSGTIPSFQIEYGSILTISCKEPALNILFDSGTNAIIAGIFRINTNNPNINIDPKISAMDSLTINVKPTGKVLIDNNVRGSTFGVSGMSNIIVFENGSILEQRSGSEIHAYITYDRIGALTKIKYLSGSNYIFIGNNTAITGKELGNFIYKSNIINYPLIIMAPTSVENFQIDSGSVNLEIRNVLNIKGNIIVNSPGELVINAANNNAIINLIGNSSQIISGTGRITILSTNNQPININLKNPNGLTFQRNLDLGNCKLSIDSSFINLNGNNLTIGQDSLNYGNLKINKSYITGNGSLTRWFPSNNSVTNNLDSIIFPFGTYTQNRSFWVSGNFTQSGTLTVSHNNMNGFTTLANPFNDNLSNALLVNARQNYNWQVTKNTSLKGTNLTIKAIGQLDSNFINTPSNVRITLSSAKAPGNYIAGSFFNGLPLATRNQITDSFLNNTFYLGANGNFCSEPEPPQVISSNICFGNKATLKAVGKGKISWFTDSIAGIRLANDSVYVTPSLTQSTFYYVQDSTCTISKRSRIKVMLLPKPNITISANATVVCQGQSITLSGNGAKTYSWNNNIINNQPFKPTVNTSYKVIGTDSNGCIDSAFINIVVNNNPSVMIQASENPICAKMPVKLTASGGNLYFWSDGIINGQLFLPTVTKTYSVTVFNEKGCSDTASIKLNVKPLPNAEITKNKTVLTATLSGANYQWLNCNNKNIITGAIGQSFIATNNGDYAVIVSQNGCKDTSICINVNSVGLIENQIQMLKIYPNPATSQLNITNNCNIKTVLIYNVTGQLVKELTYENNNLKDVSLAIDDLAQGMYMVQIIDELDAKVSRKFMKE